VPLKKKGILHMRSNAAIATNIRQPARGRGHTDPRRVAAASVGQKVSEGETISPAMAARKPGEQRVLFWNLSPSAAEALRTMAEGTRYEGAKDIEETLECGTKVTGPLRTREFLNRLCALQKDDPTIDFASAGQKKRGVFYPLTCADNDPVAMAMANALAEAS
jgi:hypothetical protein